MKAVVRLEENGVGRNVEAFDPAEASAARDTA